MSHSAGRQVRARGGARPDRQGARSSRWVRLWLLCLVAFVAVGCERAAVRRVAAEAPQVVLTTPEAAPSHVFSWRARVGASDVHLLGSVHVARRELYPLDARIDAAFEASDVLMLELDLNEANKLAAAQRMMELAQLPPGVRLRDVVAPSTWDLLVQTEKREQVTLLGLRGFRPWFVALTLTTQALERQGFSAEQGIDEHFRRRASGRKRIEALETVDEQLQLFSGLSAETEELMLAQTVRELGEYGAQLDAAFEAWRRGDAPALEALLVEPMRREYPALFEQLFTARNHRMLDRLLAATAARPGRYFVVVGAGHLLGDTGLVDLLAQRGIVVAQL